MPAPTIDGSGVIEAAINDVGSYTSSANAKTTAGSNRIGLVIVAGYMFGTSLPNGTTVTWGGVSMDKLDEAAYSVDDDFYAGLFFIKNPPTSGSTIAATFAGNLTGGVLTASYQDVDQTTPFGTVAKANGSSGTATVDVTSASGELVIDAGMFSNLPTAGAGQTQAARANQADKYAFHSYEAGAGTVTMSWTATTNPWVILGVALKPFTGDPFVINALRPAIFAPGLAH